MTTQLRCHGTCKRLLCAIFAAAIATLPSAEVIAQTNAAAMAVRQRVEGLQAGPEGQPPAASPESPHSVSPESPPTSSPGTGPTAPGKLDTRYIPSNAAAVIVLRPAQLLKSPIAQMLP